MLRGIDSLNANEYRPLTLVYRFLIEKIIIKSLIDSLENNQYLESKKEMIKEFLQKHLILDKKLLHRALEGDREVEYGICKDQLLSSKIEQNILKTDTKKMKNLYKNICLVYDKKLSNYNKELTDIENIAQKRSLEEKMQKSKTSFYKRLNSIEQKSKKELDKLKENPDYYINIIADLLFYTSYMRAGDLQLEILQRVKENRELLSNFISKQDAKYE